MSTSSDASTPLSNIPSVAPGAEDEAAATDAKRAKKAAKKAKAREKREGPAVDEVDAALAALSLKSVTLFDAISCTYL
jgi:hypothetical protein